MASRTQGYDVERFVTEVNRIFICSICHKVLRDPVQCLTTVHLFCRDCITRHFKVSHTCPSCHEALTLKTLDQASRIVVNHLNELYIYCEHSNRGCRKFVQLQHLEQHEATCGFKPAMCTNKGCGATVNQRDLIYHERWECKFGKMTCHMCEMRKTLEDMERRMEKQNAQTLAEEWKLKREKDKIECIKIRMQLKEKKANMEFQVKEIKFRRENAGTPEAKPESRVNEGELEQKIKKISEMELIALKVEVQLQEEEVLLLKLEEGSTDTKSILFQLRHLEDGLKSILYELYVNDPKLCIPTLELKLQAMVNNLKAIEKIWWDETASKPKFQQRTALDKPTISQLIIVLGGCDRNGQSLRSVEGFIFYEGRWIELPPMNIARSSAASVLVDNQIIVSGGVTADYTVTDTIETLNLDETPLQWIMSAATLPVPLSGHKTVVHEGKFITIGGHDGNEGINTNKIYEAPLIPPYTHRVLTSLPQRMAGHGAELVNDKIFIFGGGATPFAPNNKVVVCDLSSEQCNEMQSQLPYRVQGMATVRLEKQVFLLGGVDEREEKLDNVITYDIHSGATVTLPSMAEKRGGCCAVLCPAVESSSGGLSGFALVALGQLNTVERFNLHSHAWSYMPSTTVARESSTAVISPVDLAQFEKQ